MKFRGDRYKGKTIMRHFKIIFSNECIVTFYLCTPKLIGHIHPLPMGSPCVKFHGIRCNGKAVTSMCHNQFT